MTKKDEFEGKAVVAVMLVGTVKSDDADATSLTIAAITEAAAARMDIIDTDVEIVDPGTDGDIREALLEMRESAKEPGNATSFLLLARMGREDEEDRKNYIPPTPEEEKAETDRIAKLRREAKETAEREHAAERHTYFATAEKWGAKPNLNAAEAAHGVAHDLYATYGKTGEIMKTEDGGLEVVYGGPKLSEDYRHTYSNLKASDIQLKLMRAAADLFD